MHLYEWHAMLERWYREGMDGNIPSMPAPGYKWRLINKLNLQIWHQYQDVKLSTAIKNLSLAINALFTQSKPIMMMKSSQKKYYKWTKTSNLYSYFAANTTDHYNWAIKKCEIIAKQILSN